VTEASRVEYRRSEWMSNSQRRPPAFCAAVDVQCGPTYGNNRRVNRARPTVAADVRQTARSPDRLKILQRG